MKAARQAEARRATTLREAGLPVLPPKPPQQERPRPRPLEPEEPPLPPDQLARIARHTLGRVWARWKPLAARSRQLAARADLMATHRLLRRCWSVWWSQAAASLQERLEALRERRKWDVACRFHRLWQLHASVQRWRAEAATGREQRRVGAVAAHVLGSTFAC